LNFGDQEIQLEGEFSSDQNHKIGIQELIRLMYNSNKDVMASLSVDLTSNPIIILAVTFLIGSGLIYAFFFYKSEDPPSKVEEKKEPIPPRDFTIEQLRAFNGKDGAPIYISLKGDVFDVTSAAAFYGPGAGEYAIA
jgi:hypothetical protein